MISSNSFIITATTTSINMFIINSNIISIVFLVLLSLISLWQV